MTARMLLWSSLVVYLAATGCSKDPAPTGGGTASAPAPAVAAKPSPPDTADGAVRAIIEQLNQNHPEAVWDFLPASYQKDLNDLVHSFAEKMDPELWNRSVAAIHKVAGMLKSKKEFLAPEMNGVADVLETLLATDLADLEKLKTLDGGKLLAETAGKLFALLRKTGHHPFGDDMGIFNDVTVMLVHSQGDSATVALEFEGDLPHEYELVRIDGKWIPRVIAEGWIEQIGEARARLVLLSPDNMAETKPQVLALFTALESALDDISAAETRADFQAALAQADTTMAPFKSLLAGWLGTAGATPSAPAPPSSEPIELVTVVVKGMLDEDAQDQLREKLNSASDDPAGSESEMTGDDETTTIRLGPVSDVEAFAKRLEFLKIVEVDARRRIITAEPKP